MAFWNKHGDGNWGRVPPLRVEETVRLKSVEGDGTWQARVRAIGARRIILDVAPSEHGVPVRQPITLLFERGDALYHFEARVLTASRRGSITLSWPRRVVRVQRREFYRLLLERPTTLRVLTVDGRVGAAEPVAVRLVNLSGGGALLSLGTDISGGALVSVRVPLGKDGSPQGLEARVLDCLMAGSGGSRAYLARLRWTETLDDSDREAIIAFLHEQQRMMLRARKLFRA